MIIDCTYLKKLIGKEFSKDTVYNEILKEISTDTHNDLSLKVLELTAPTGNAFKGILALNGFEHKFELDKIKSTYITKSISIN